MTALRHRSRHMIGTVRSQLVTGLTTTGWITPPINFGAAAVTIIDHVPADRINQIAPSTVAISLGESPGDNEEELGGLMGAFYPVFIDSWMDTESYGIAFCDDVRDIFQFQAFNLVDQTTGAPAAGWMVEVEEVLGPEKLSAFVGAQVFKTHWHTMRLGCRVYYNP